MSTASLRRPKNFDEVLAKLTQSRKSGNEYIGDCPCQGHSTPDGHLSLTNAGDKALVTCHGQGTTHTYEQICQVWEYDSLTYENGYHKSEWRVTSSFVYEHESGKEYYIIDRQENGIKKKFVAKHKVNGEYVYNMNGLSPILYRLPELRGAVKAGKSILIPEGERKADRLRELGFEASTSPFGAGKWNDSFTRELSGADVVILPDYDKPGLGFAEQKAKVLHRTAKRVRIVQLTDVESLKKTVGKEGVDIINWLDAGHTREELQSLMDKSQDWKPTDSVAKVCFRLTRLSDLLCEPDEDIDYLWENTLIKGGLSILAAKPKVGKSTLARNLALSTAKGEVAFLGRNITDSGSVVYLALEEKRSEIKKHFQRMGAAENLPIFIHTGSAPEKAVQELRQVIITNRAVLAIVDPLQRLVRISDLNDYSSVSLALEPLLQIARDTGCHILLIHHANKGIAREGGDDILGSTAIFGSVDCALIMKRSDTYRTIESIQRYGEDLPRTVLAFDVVTGLTSSGGSLEDVEAAECGKAILDILDHEMTEKEIKDGITDYKGGVVSKSLRLLCEQGKTQRQGHGRKGDPYRYRKNAGDSGDTDIEIPTIPTISSECGTIPSYAQNAGDTDSRLFDDKGDFQSPTIEAILGMPVKKALEIWRSEGAPLVHLENGENCLDLEKLLLNPHVSEKHLQAVRAWIEKVQARPKSGSVSF